MAYPTGMLSVILEDIDRRMIRLKATVEAARTAANSAVAAPRIIELWAFLKGERIALVSAATTPGLPQYARDQKNDQGLDIVAEFTAVIAAIDSVVSWIATNTPQDGSGFLLVQTFGTTTLTDRTFTAGQLAGYRTQLDALIATIL